MGLADWLRSFRELHEKAKRGGLHGHDLALYQGGREELARALLAAQRIALLPGQKPRRALRVARALQADLEFADGNVRALTLDLSSHGFSVLVERPPRVGEQVRVALRIPGGEPLCAAARVQEVRLQAGNARVSFEMTDLSEAALERLELFVFDAVLTQLQG